MDSEPLFIYEDDSYQEQLEEIARKFKTQKKPSKEAIFLRNILKAAIQQKAKKKKAKTKFPKEVGKIDDTTRLLFSGASPTVPRDRKPQEKPRVDVSGLDAPEPPKIEAPEVMLKELDVPMPEQFEDDIPKISSPKKRKK